MNDDRYVILNSRDEYATSAPVDSITAVTENRYDRYPPYTAHKIDPEPTVAETREEKLERLVDWIYCGTSMSEAHPLAVELRDSREAGQ